jgi:peptide/nickel transport system permease protein
MLIMIVAMRLKLLPVVGYKDLSYIILPSVALSISIWAVFTRTIRVSLGEVLHQDYIKGAISRGISTKRVVMSYAFKNILSSLLVVMGVQIGVLFGGAMIIEYIFNFPGIGLLTVNAVLRRDYPLIQILVILMSGIFMIINLLVDICNIGIDPRARKAK